jgi:hypothetical protein
LPATSGGLFFVPHHENNGRRTMRHVPTVAVYAACGLVLLLAWLALQPYAAPVPTGPFLPGYSAVRAQQHMQAIAQAPRPAGSIANARARDYLLARIRALGLAPYMLRFP